ncbi:hypothetical protein [Promicromonospora sp. MEB111]|uniref:hypothetical protein n=1 Tax=Promicromonospora sp. MEB111 TaxID=3040301 RepID=UPI00254B4456|nr:hypothetical protein [Promicromonospora sp. MEB111]
MSKLLVEAWDERVSSALRERGWSALRLMDVTVYERRVGECHNRFVADVIQQASRIIPLPKVGVHYSEIKKVAEGVGWVGRNATATVGIDLIHLIRKIDGGSGATRWMLSDVGQIDATVDRLVGDLEMFGEPFYYEFSTIDRLLSGYGDFTLSAPQRLEVAIAFSLRGKLQAARRIVDGLKADDSVVDMGLLNAIAAFDRSWRQYE